MSLQVCRLKMGRGRFSGRCRNDARVASLAMRIVSRGASLDAYIRTERAELHLELRGVGGCEGEAAG